ncbi:MAG TPA: hypothetical protein VFR15_05570, partial [Chloroflexia bacterium]|nr:hypothetical protein [Chloroflexia bacterium]
SVYGVLEGLIARPETWAEVGRRGVEYVRREHEMHQVARRALASYGRRAGASISSSVTEGAS